MASASISLFTPGLGTGRSGGCIFAPPRVAASAVGLCVRVLVGYEQSPGENVSNSSASAEAPTSPIRVRERAPP